MNLCTMSLRTVFHQGHASVKAHSSDARHVCHLAVEVGHNDGCRGVADK